jgi:hypothetical protein
MTWKDNPIVEWSLDGTSWTKVTDHGRAPLDVQPQRIENSQRMANGTMRRYVVAKKRRFEFSWENIPSVDTDFLAGGEPGEWIEDWHNDVDGAFYMRLRTGKAIDNDEDNMEVVIVMITDFSKSILKRGPVYDLWNLDMTLEEV